MQRRAGRQHRNRLVVFLGVDQRAAKADVRRAVAPRVGQRDGAAVDRDRFGVRAAHEALVRAVDEPNVALADAGAALPCAASSGLRATAVAKWRSASSWRPSSRSAAPRLLYDAAACVVPLAHPQPARIRGGRLLELAELGDDRPEVDTPPHPRLLLQRAAVEARARAGAHVPRGDERKVDRRHASSCLKQSRAPAWSPEEWKAAQGSDIDCAVL